MQPGQVRAAVWSGVLATFVALVAGHWFPMVRLPILDLATANGRVLVPGNVSADLLWLAGVGQLFGGGVVMALFYALYVQMHLPGPGWLRGMMWGGVLAIFMGLTTIPLLYNGGIFGSAWDGVVPVSVIAWHLLWGCVLGIAYHKPRPHGDHGA